MCHRQTDACVRSIYVVRRMHSQHHGGGKPAAVSHVHRQRDSKQRGSKQHDSKHKITDVANDQSFNKYIN